MTDRDLKQGLFRKSLQVRNHAVLSDTSGITSKFLNDIIEEEPTNMSEVSIMGSNFHSFNVGQGIENATHIDVANEYTIGTLRNIISKMEIIESHMEDNWNDLQKSLYFFEVLMTAYPMDRRGTVTNISERHPKYLNLSPFVSDSKHGATDANYAMMYKELCARQGIKCEIVTGTMSVGDGEDETLIDRVWNIIDIRTNGEDYRYLVDLQMANQDAFYIDLTGGLVYKGASNENFFANTKTADKYKPYDSRAYDEKSISYISGIMQNALANNMQANVDSAVKEVAPGWTDAKNALKEEMTSVTNADMLK